MTENTEQPPHLLPFAGNPREDMPKSLPFRLEDYLELVDWTGRILREERGAIPANLPWLYMSKHFESRFKGLVSAACKLKAACESLGYRRTPNLAVSRELLI